MSMRPRRWVRRLPKAKAIGITRVAFDRSGFKYHGRIKALAEPPAKTVWVLRNKQHGDECRKHPEFRRFAGKTDHRQPWPRLSKAVASSVSRR